MDSPQMNAEERRYKHAELTEQIIGVFYEVYNELGIGFLEKVYREAMALVLRSKGLDVSVRFLFLCGSVALGSAPTKPIWLSPGWCWSN